MKRPLLVPFLATFFLLVGVQSAQAANFCVGAAAFCPSGATLFPAGTAIEFQDALDAAADTMVDDTVYLAAGTYDVGTVPGPVNNASVEDLAHKVNIVGAGRGQTIITRTGGNGPVLSVVARPGSVVRDLTVAYVNGNSNGYALELAGGSGENLAITMDAGYSQPAVMLSGALRNSSVQTNSSDGISNGGSGSVELSNVAVQGPFVIGGGTRGLRLSGGGTFELSRVRLSGFETGARIGNGHAYMSDSAIEIGSGSSAVGIEYRMTSSTSSVLSIERSTLMGTGINQRGIWAYTVADPSTSSFPIYLADSLIDLRSGSGQRGIRCGFDSAGGASFAVQFRSSAWTSDQINLPNCNFDPGTGSLLNLLATPPNYVGSGDHPLRPVWDSPVIDLGSAGGDPEALDAAAGRRYVDGRSPFVQGPAKVDLGAYEYQAGAPVLSLAASVTNLEIGEQTTFTASATDPEGETLTYDWKLDGVASPSHASSLAAEFSSPGVHSAEVTVTDVAGVASSASQQVVVSAPIVPDPPFACPTSAPAKFKITTKPKKTFKRGRAGFKVVKKARQPYFALKVHTAGTYGLKLWSVRRNGDAVAVKGLAGQQNVKLKTGTNKLTFGGKWNKKKLKKGSYQVTVVPAVTTSCNSDLVYAAVNFKLK